MSFRGGIAGRGWLEDGNEETSLGKTATGRNVLALKKRARNEPNDYLVHAPSTTLRRTAMEKAVGTRTNVIARQPSVSLKEQKPSAWRISLAIFF